MKWFRRDNEEENQPTIDLKYYIYISDTKLDMLFEQMPPKIRDNLAKELKIDAKIVSTTLKEGPTEKTRMYKLKIVSEYFDNHVDVGTINAPKSYFHGTMPLRWDILSTEVLFAGRTENTGLILGGSAKNVLGIDDVQNVKGQRKLYASALPGLWELLEILGSKESTHDLIAERLKSGAERFMHNLVMGNGLAQFSKTEQQLEFLAIRLLANEVEIGDKRYKYLIGSPIYVGLAEQ